MCFFFQRNITSITCTKDKPKVSSLESHLTNKEALSVVGVCLLLTSRVPLPLQDISEQMDEVKVQLQSEVKKVASLQAKVSEGEVGLFETL